MIDLVLPCPFCGHEVDLTDGDTLYPNGTVWKWEQNRRGMLVRKFYPRFTRDENNQLQQASDFDGQVWGFHCVETSGGCGIVVEGYTASEATEKWQRRNGFDYINWR